MTPDLDRLLCMRYPTLFQRRNWSMDKSCMYWGFPGNGWFNLIDTLAERLQFWTDHRGAPQAVAEQVKEKLGALRLYSALATNGDHISEEQRGMIHMASAMSERVCEVCGHPGWMVVECGWYRARCAAHRDRRINDPVPVLYLFAGQGSEHAIGQVAVGGTPAATLAETDAAALLRAAHKAGYDELQVVRVRDLAELPTRLAE